MMIPASPTSPWSQPSSAPLAIATGLLGHILQRPTAGDDQLHPEPLLHASYSAWVIFSRESTLRRNSKTNVANGIHDQKERAVCAILEDFLQAPEKFDDYHVLPRMQFLAIAMIQCIEGRRDALEYTQKVQDVGRCPSGADILSILQTTTLISRIRCTYICLLIKLINNPCNYQLET